MTAEATGDVVGNEIADKITGASSPKSIMPPQTDEPSIGWSREYYKIPENGSKLLVSQDYFDKCYIRKEWSIRKS